MSAGGDRAGGDGAGGDSVGGESARMLTGRARNAGCGGIDL